MPIAECEVKKAFRIPHSELGHTLASGPQACFFAEKAIAKVKVGKESMMLTEKNLNGIDFKK